MQYPFSLIPESSAAIHAALSPERMTKYLAEARGDTNLAVQLYHWNCRLCGAFYPPINLAEVAVRNSVSLPVAKRFGSNWHEEPKFRNILDAKKKSELDSAIRRERNQHGRNLTAHHVTSALTFGFWVGLMAKSYDQHLWATGIKKSFPNAGAAESRASIHTKIDRVRDIRNDIMHYRSVFDKSPRRLLTEIQSVIALISPDAHFFIAQTSEIEQVISQKPKAV